MKVQYNGPHKRGNIVMEILFPEMFLGCAKKQEAKNIFCILAVQMRKHLPSKQMLHACKHGNIRETVFP